MELLNLCELEGYLLNWLNTYYYCEDEANFAEVQEVAVDYSEGEACNCTIKIHYGRFYLEEDKAGLSEEHNVDVECEPELLDNWDYVLGLFAAKVRDN